MHMSDALISPATGGAMWVAAAALTGRAAYKIRKQLDEKKIPLMGVMAAFVFAAQMINFSIPGTGSSGHIGGGMLLAVILGPDAAFLAIASVLLVQGLFFADGGLLAMGCNIINMGFFPAYVIYPLVFKPLAGINPGRKRLSASLVFSSTAALLLGALSVVIQTVLSGISSLPFWTFAMLMLPIHFAIGLVEGVITATVVWFVRLERPDLLHDTGTSIPLRRVAAGLAIGALVTGGVISWYASGNPDGLEWSVAHVTGSGELAASTHGIHGVLSRLQEKTSFLPDYGFRSHKEDSSKAGTSVSGVTGGLLCGGLIMLTGYLLRLIHKKQRAKLKKTKSA